MERQRHFYSVAGVAAVVVAISVIVPAMRPSPAQDASGRMRPAVAPAPQLGPVQLAQLPLPEPALPATEPAPAPLPAPQPAAPAELPAPAPAPAPPAGQPIADDRIQLRTLTAEQLHARIEQIFGRPAPVLPADGSIWMRFTVQTGADASVLVAVQPQTGEVRLTGRPDQLKPWREIITAIDAPTGPDRATEILAADEATAPRVRRTVEMLLAQAQVPAQGPAEGGVLPGGIPNLPAGLLGPVEIVNIEGTSLFIIQGNPRDVARALEIIRQIQEMSSVSAPQMVTRQLKYVGSEAIATLLRQLFGPATAGGPATLGSYYGNILALPLGRPNSLLLVGSPGTIEKVEEILDQLDMPAEAATQFEVFRLKYANAATAQPVVEQLFVTLAAEEAAAAPPFRPQALVIAEPRTNALIVRASPTDMEDVRRLINEIDQPGGEAVNELRVFKLKFSLAATLAPVLQRAMRGEASAVDGGGGGGAAAATGGGLATLLRMVTIDAAGQQKLESGVLAGVTVNADTRANALVVSAPPESMPLLSALIAQLDQPPDAIAQLKVFTIKNGDAVSLAQMLQDLFGAPQTGGGAGGGGGGGFGGGGGGGGAQNAAAQVFQLRFSVDERTNSIIAAGSDDELLVVEAILLRLDAGESRSRLNTVYRLKNASAQDVAFALQNWLQQKRDVEQTAPGVVSPFAQLEREVVVVAEIASNSLIVSATPSYYKELQTIIQQLDEQAPMVMIQVLIGEVRLGDADEFGVEFGLQDSALFDRSVLQNIANITTTTQTQSPGGAVTNVTQQVVQTADLTPGFNFGNAAQGLPNSGSDRSLATAGIVGAQGLSSFAVNRVSPDLGFGGLVLSASSNSVSMLLRALQESRRIEVLSRPQINVLDNQTGRAFVGQIVPIITGQTLNGLGVPPTNNVEQQAVGLELLVTPRISPEDLVVMRVSAAKRELGPIDQGVPIAIAANGDLVRSPIINSTEAQTTVSAVSGQTVILSGLLTKRDEALHRRVPLLADIPLLGSLFRFDSSRLVRTELLIILTPHVIRSRAESERLNQVESARMSWCLSDVVDLHGAVGMRSRTDPLGAAHAEAIYPDATPSEVGPLGPALDGEMMPSPNEGVYLSPPEPSNWPPNELRSQPMPTPSTPTLPQATP